MSAAGGSGIAGAGSEGRVRVVRVTRDGASAGWGALQAAVDALPPSGFVAVDTEFSGLSGDPRLSDADLGVRYDALRAVADSRALVSLGVSVFRPADPAPPADPARHAAITYHVSTFDFTLCCETPWTVAPESGRFLVAHGFDFNRLFQSGIPYVRASTARDTTPGAASAKAKFSVVNNLRTAAKPALSPTAGAAAANNFSVSAGPSPPSSAQPASLQKARRRELAGDPRFVWGPMPTGLLWRLGRAGVPIVVHNGLLDLVFMYAAFHGPLPETLNRFVSALLDAAPAGFVDTKHLATMRDPKRASFLSYVYARCVQEKRVYVSSAAGLPRPEVASPDDYGARGLSDASVSKAVASQELPAALTVANGQNPTSKSNVTLDVCMLYSVRGFCPKGTRCELPHDAFRILELEKSSGLPDIHEARKLYKAQRRIISARLNALVAAKRKSEGLTNSEGGSPGAGPKRRKLNKKERKRLLGLLHVDPERAAADMSSGVCGNQGPQTQSPAIGLSPTDDIVENVASQSSRVTCDASGTPANVGSGSEENPHCAGWDAYMTGFCFAVLRAVMEKDVLAKEHNKLSLSKKGDMPLYLSKSSFEELNVSHVQI